ncbi:MAG: hypothetical protein GX442_16060 [Candidatus Riflebacteria bacterium]|nr:hypothetical protein [Candidatus Riflebacteria bacterium]
MGSAHRWRRGALVALLLFLAGVGLALYVAVATTAGAAWLVGQATGFLARDQGIVLKVEGLAGSLWDGVTLATCTGRLPGNRLSFQVSSLTLEVLVLPSLQKGLTVGRCACASATLWGPPLATWTETLPPIPFECWMGGGGRPEIRALDLGRVDWLPDASGPLHVFLEGVRLAPPVGAGASQALHLAAGVEVHGRPAARGTFEGAWSNREAALSGLLAGALLGQPVSSEVRVACGKGACVLSGQLHPVDLDLSSFSRWLCPLWQGVAPVGAEGRLRGGGSWAWDPRVGGLANLSGEARGVRLVAVGLFWPILELNVAWRLFDGRLSVTDLGSSLLGAPALVAGGVALGGGGGPDWDLRIDVPRAEMAEVLGGLPWVVRTGFQLPAMSGVASLAVQLHGAAPQVTGGLWADELLIRHPAGEARLHGRAEVRREAVGGDQWQVGFDWSAPAVPVGVFDRLTAGGMPLSQRLSGPLTLRARLDGPAADHLRMRLWAESAGGGVGLLGVWSGDGWGSLRLAADGFRWDAPPDLDRAGEPVAAHGVGLRDLALLQAR